MASFADNTISQYNSSIKAWWCFCKKYSLDLFDSSPKHVLTFLTEVFESGIGYSSLNTYRSALSIILDKHITRDDSVTRFLKGVYRLRTPKPKYNFTWDPITVLTFLATYFPHQTVNLSDLTTKTVTLLALASAQRIQTLSLIKIKNIFIKEDFILIKITDLIKTSRPGACQPLIKLPFLRENPEICPALALQAYIDITKTLRCEQSKDYLFISIRKPHKNVGAQTLSHWVKKVLERSGIDIGIFGAHSTRHASTSAAHNAGVNLEVVRRAAGWSDSSNVFYKYYKKDVISDSDNFVQSVFQT